MGARRLFGGSKAKPSGGKSHSKRLASESYKSAGANVKQGRLGKDKSKKGSGKAY
jgi:hypothetical protein